MAAQWAPYQREGEPVQSCILVQTRFRGRQDGVPVSRTLKGEPGWLWGGSFLPRAGKSLSTSPEGWEWGQCQWDWLSMAFLCQPM